jgi:trehalose-6-phosphate synthase
MAEALERALVMPEPEQKERMHLMRDLLRVRNVYRWAGQMLLDAARLRSQQRIVAESLAEAERGRARRLEAVPLAERSQTPRLQGSKFDPSVVRGV